QKIFHADISQEADALAVFLCCNRQPEFGRKLANARFFESSYRKQYMRHSVLGQRPQKVALILLSIDTFKKPRRAVKINNGTSIVARCDHVRSPLAREPEKSPEFDVPVAHDI